MTCLFSFCYTSQFETTQHITNHKYMNFNFYISIIYISSVFMSLKLLAFYLVSAFSPVIATGIPPLESNLSAGQCAAEKLWLLLPQISTYRKHGMVRPVAAIQLLPFRTEKFLPKYNLDPINVPAEIKLQRLLSKRPHWKIHVLFTLHNSSVQG